MQKGGVRSPNVTTWRVGGAAVENHKRCGCGGTRTATRAGQRDDDGPVSVCVEVVGVSECTRCVVHSEFGRSALLEEEFGDRHERRISIPSLLLRVPLPPHPSIKYYKPSMYMTSTSTTTFSHALRSPYSHSQARTRAREPGLTNIITSKHHPVDPSLPSASALLPSSTPLRQTARANSHPN